MHEKNHTICTEGHIALLQGGRGGAARRWGACLALAGLAILAGCASGPTHPSLAGARLPDLVPVRDFVASRQSTGGYRVSPDGQRIAWFGIDGVAPAIWVQPVDGGSAKAFRIKARSIRFSADSRWLGINHRGPHG
jgi:hypothetical protein